MKLNHNDFKDKDGHFYQEAGDLSLYISLAEISGPERTLFVDEYSLKIHK